MWIWLRHISTSCQCRGLSHSLGWRSLKCGEVWGSVDLVAPHQHVLPVQGALPLVGLAQPEVWGGVEKFGGWEV